MCAGMGKLKSPVSRVDSVLGSIESMRRRLCILLFLTGAIGTAQADTVRVTFDGHVIDGATFATGIPNGTPVTGTLKYSTDIGDVNSSPTIGDYRLLFSALSLSVGTQQISVFGLSGIYQGNRIFIEKRPTYDIFYSATRFNSATQFNGWAPFDLEITLSDAGQTALADDSLPISISLNDWDGLAADCFLCNNRGWLVFQQGGGSSQVSASIAYDHLVAELLPHDDAPPTVSGAFAMPSLLAVNTNTDLTATVDDSATGNSAIVSAEYSIDGGLYAATVADDGVFNSSTEVVTGTVFGFTEPGVYEACIRGTDELGNTSDPAADPANACTLIVAYDPNGGFVTGGGWIYSAAGACQYNSVCGGAAGKANFGFVSRYKKGATIPTGNTQFQFSAGGLNFHSETYDWLVVNMNGTNAQYKGSGTVNGNLGPAGEAYKFMLWARDFGNTGADTFRMKIWYVDAGSEIVVYDNGFSQEIGGGNIVIQTK